MTTASPFTERQYTAPEVLAGVGCEYRWLDHMCRSGALDPDRTGTAAGRSFSVADVEVLHAAHHMYRAGIGSQLAFTIARELGTRGEWQLETDVYTITVAVKAGDER